MRRTLYIGLGGTGIKVIDGVKKQIVSTYGNVPPVIKFLGIDTSDYECSRTSLSVSEKVLLRIVHPGDVYRHHPNDFADLPIKNIGFIDDIRSSGAGIIRSNGEFLRIYDSKERQVLEHSIRSIVDYLFWAGNLAMLQNNNIDVHLCFSLCGGTGSGIFIELMKLIRKTIPNANLICYAFSCSFFSNRDFVHRDLHKANEYGALLEADYMIANSGINVPLVAEWNVPPVAQSNVPPQKWLR